MTKLRVTIIAVLLGLIAAFVAAELLFATIPPGVALPLGKLTDAQAKSIETMLKLCDTFITWSVATIGGSAALLRFNVDKEIPYSRGDVYLAATAMGCAGIYVFCGHLVFDLTNRALSLNQFPMTLTSALPPMRAPWRLRDCVLGAPSEPWPYYSAYRWRRRVIGSQGWTKSDNAVTVAKPPAAVQFARVTVLRLTLANGRRAKLDLDIAQLGEVLEMLECRACQADRDGIGISFGSGISARFRGNVFACRLENPSSTAFADTLATHSAASCATKTR
jgi:hypothetical protein